MPDRELKKIFQDVIKFLSGIAAFQDISLKGKLMNKSDKKSFYSYMRGTKVVNQQQKVFDFSAVIYVNLRDIQDKNKLLEAVAHEAAHIKEGDFVENRDFFRNLLRERFGT